MSKRKAKDLEVVDDVVSEDADVEETDEDENDEKPEEVLTPIPGAVGMSYFAVLGGKKVRLVVPLEELASLMTLVLYKGQNPFFCWVSALGLCWFKRKEIKAVFNNPATYSNQVLSSLSHLPMSDIALVGKHLYSKIELYLAEQETQKISEQIGFLDKKAI